MQHRHDPNYTTFREEGPKPDAYEHWTWKLEKVIGKYVDVTGQRNLDAYIIAFYAKENDIDGIKSLVQPDEFESVIKIDDLITIILGRSSKVKELMDLLISNTVQPLALLTYNLTYNKSTSGICTPSVLLSYLERALEEAKRNNVLCKSVDIDICFLTRVRNDLDC